jgi:PKD repeat protein
MQEGSYDVTLTASNSYGSDTVKKTGTSAPVTLPVTTVPATTAPPTQATTAPPTTVATQPGQVPGFGWVLAITGLAVLVLLARRH